MRFDLIYYVLVSRRFAYFRSKRSRLMLSVIYMQSPVVGKWPIEFTLTKPNCVYYIGYTNKCGRRIIHMISYVKDIEMWVFCGEDAYMMLRE